MKRVNNDRFSLIRMMFSLEVSSTLKEMKTFWINSEIHKFSEDNKWRMMEEVTNAEEIFVVFATRCNRHGSFYLVASLDSMSENSSDCRPAWNAGCEFHTRHSHSRREWFNRLNCWYRQPPHSCWKDPALHSSSKSHWTFQIPFLRVRCLICAFS
jgi:hypothetical protein